MAGTKEDCWTQSSTITAECLESNENRFKNFLSTEGGEQIRSYVIQTMMPIIKTQPYPEPREKYILQLTINAGYDFIMATPAFGIYLGQKKP